MQKGFLSLHHFRPPWMTEFFCVNSAVEVERSQAALRILHVIPRQVAVEANLKVCLLKDFETRTEVDPRVSSLICPVLPAESPA